MMNYENPLTKLQRNITYELTQSPPACPNVVGVPRQG